MSIQDIEFVRISCKSEQIELSNERKIIAGLNLKGHILETPCPNSLVAGAQLSFNLMFAFL